MPSIVLLISRASACVPKVDNFYMATFFYYIYILSDMWVGVAPRTYIKKTYVQKRFGRVSNTITDSKLTTRQNRGDLCDQLTSLRIFTLIINKIFT